MNSGFFAPLAVFFKFQFFFGGSFVFLAVIIDSLAILAAQPD